MKNITNTLIFLILLVTVYVFTPNHSFAFYDPLAVPNNFIGIHILFTSELDEAARLVNSNGGDWGYVTIPIQSTDRDLEKWQIFMDKCSQLHLIPILRIATKLEHIKKIHWKKPDDFDLVHFANFMNSLSWPTKNRYIILFNEINRFDEWGGEYPDPVYYSQIVSSAYEIFKERSNDFFLIMGGFDNASITDRVKYINEYEFMSKMLAYDNKILNKIDGFASHSYPNPAFSDTPNTYKRVGVSTYKYEYNFIQQYSDTKKYIFITETGWDSVKVGDENVKKYFSETFLNIWNNDRDKIVAITPFLLNSEQGLFDRFSFFKNGKPTAYYDAVYSMPKTKGSPLIAEKQVLVKEKEKLLPIFFFSDNNEGLSNVEIPEILKLYAKVLLGIN